MSYSDKLPIYMLRRQGSALTALKSRLMNKRVTGFILMFMAAKLDMTRSTARDKVRRPMSYNESSQNFSLESMSTVTCSGIDPVAVREEAPLRGYLGLLIRAGIACWTLYIQNEAYSGSVTIADLGKAA